MNDTPAATSWWTYKQSTGELFDPAGAFVMLGYAGHGDGINNPCMQEVKNVGPPPVGLWKIWPARDDPHLGPCVLMLTLMEGNAFGRDGFYMHGDNRFMNRTASNGCIIMPPLTRHSVASSAIKLLRIIP